MSAIPLVAMPVDTGGVALVSPALHAVRIENDSD